MNPSETFCLTLEQSLVDEGFNPFQASLVARFVTQCYEVLLSAHQALVLPSRWEEFCVARGAKTKRRKHSSKPANISETAISAHLSLEAQLLLQKNGVLKSLVDGACISCVIADHTSPSDFATGSSSKRPDLVFFPANPALRLQFSMEAKIIRVAADIANDLLGEAGFGCFVRAIDPYETNGVVGLVGYVESANASDMLQEAERCMRADRRFKKVNTQNLIVEAGNSNYTPHTVMGRICDSKPKVCFAHMLAVPLITV
jgi:hypothetical protein